MSEVNFSQVETLKGEHLCEIILNLDQWFMADHNS